MKTTHLNCYLLAVGATLVALGCLIILKPFQAYYLISLSFSILLVVTGVMELLFSIKNKQMLEEWKHFLLSGVLSILVGCYLLFSLALALLFVTSVVSIWMFYKGFISLRLAVLLKKYRIKQWWIQLLIGLMIGIIGLAMLIHIDYGLWSMLGWTGLGIALIGVSYMSLSFIRFVSTLQLKR